MVGSLSPTAIEFQAISKCIKHILDQEVATLVVVCCSRDGFLRDLAAELSLSQSSSASGSTNIESSTLDLLNPTIKLIAKSKKIQIAFAPTFMHLRAYLSALSSREAAMEAHSRLSILNLLEVHRSTSEFSAQGLSRTLALLVDTSSHNGVKLDILESTKYGGIDQESDQFVSQFKERVPILNGSTRSTGDERAWAGRTVEIGSILAKWCKVFKMS